MFREFACSIGTNSCAAAEEVYAAALALLGWEGVGYRLKDWTDDQVALADPRRIAALLKAQYSAAGTIPPSLYYVCMHTHII